MKRIAIEDLEPGDPLMDDNGFLYIVLAVDLPFVSLRYSCGKTTMARGRLEKTCWKPSEEFLATLDRWKILSA